MFGMFQNSLQKQRLLAVQPPQPSKLNSAIAVPQNIYSPSSHPMPTPLMRDPTPSMRSQGGRLLGSGTRPPPPPPCPPGPLSYQGSMATGHTYGGAEGARKFCPLCWGPLSTRHPRHIQPTHTSPTSRTHPTAGTPRGHKGISRCLPPAHKYQCRLQARADCTSAGRGTV